MRAVSLLLRIFLAVAIVCPTLSSAAVKEEPWSEIEARTKFLRTKHYIEVVRVHSNVYKSARAKGGQNVSGPLSHPDFPPRRYTTP